LIRKKDKQFKDKPCCAVTDKNGERLKSNRKLDIRDNFGLNINYKNATIEESVHFFQFTLESINQ